MGVPKLEHDERPETVALIYSPIEMFLEELFDRGGIEVHPRAGTRRQQDVADARAEGRAEPLSYRGAEAPLGSGTNRRRDQVGKGALEDVLQLAPMNLVRCGQPRGKLHHTVVEERT